MPRRSANGRALAHIIRVFNDDGTLKATYELDEHARHKRPMDLPQHRKGLPLVPPPVPPPVESKPVVDEYRRSQRPPDFLTSLEDPVAFFAETLRSPVELDFQESFQMSRWSSAWPWAEEWDF
jgi:hypothetical protein